MLYGNAPGSADDPAIDLIVIGSGPAGLSAAITAKKRNKNVVVLGLPTENSAIYPSRRVDNYPGLPGISGAELLERMRSQAEDMGVTFFDVRVNSVMNYGRSFGVACGSEVLVSRAVIFCIGVNRQGLIPGEQELLGRGVSYCTTCDATFYTGEKVAVLRFVPEAEEEIRVLEDCCSEVCVFAEKGDYAILGRDEVEGISFNGEVTACKGVFILRSASVPETLLYGLQAENGHIAVDRELQTSVRGAYAAGDCTGEPYQIAKAVGEGNVAALSACAYLEKKEQTA